MSKVPRRDNSRPSFAPKKRDLIAEINADIARRAALPKDHPDYAIDDNEFTGTMGIRDNRELRDNATALTKGKKRKKNG